MPPGSLPDSANNVNQEFLNVVITNINYDQNTFKKETLLHYQQIETELESIKQSSDQSIHWIDIESLEDLSLVKMICEKLDVHPLIMEDIAHTHQRPKIEDWDNHIYLVVKMIYITNTKEIIHEQVSFILGKNYLISFQEQKGDVFNIIRKRLEANKGRVRRMQADYLMYSLLDVIADNYFLVLDSINESLITLEEQISINNEMHYIKELQSLKQEILFIRRFALPFKEMLIAIMKEESDLIREDTLVFFKDLQDHTIQILDSIDMMREISLSIFDTSRSAMNNKMNEIMRLLTVVSTIFIPITFIVGVYGMNFKYMPELETHWAYPAVWGLMLTIVIGMLVYFKRKKWL